MTLQNYALWADRLHRCAVELGVQMNALDLERLTTSPDRLVGLLREFNAHYADAIARCPENHEPLDDALFRAEHAKDTGVGRLRSWWTRNVAAHSPFLLFYILVWGLFTLAILVVLALR